MIDTDHDRIDLGGGLVMRRATAADSDALVAFNGTIHGDASNPQAQVAVESWTRDLMTKPHPCVGPADFLIVEETGSGRIASTLNLIDQTWTYDGIPFGVGRVEIVGTAPEFRGRGLVREQMRVVHAWSATRGHLVQAITGIPFFYRQFGYEMALDLDIRRPGLPLKQPAAPTDTPPAYELRAATAADLPFVARLYAAGASRYLVSCAHDDASWEYVLSGRSPASLVHDELRVICLASGEPVGFAAFSPMLWGGSITVHLYELAAGVPYSVVTPHVARHVMQAGTDAAASQGASCDGFSFCLGYDHPAYDASPALFGPPRGAYAWYVRVADLAAFLRHIAPVLERRLAGSGLCGFTGGLTLGFYRDGLRLSFASGRLTGVEPWMPTPAAGGDAQFPNLTFLQLLLGHRSLDELGLSYADCWADGETAGPLLRALFPRRRSYVWPVA